MIGPGRLANRLYQGEISIDFVSARRRRLWYVLSGVIIVLALGGLFGRGLQFGIEFKGGVEFEAAVAQPTAAVPKMRAAVISTGLETDPVVVSSGTHTVRVQTGSLNPGQIGTVQRSLKAAGASEVGAQFVGPTWGAQVANRAWLGLAVFLALVMLFIGTYFHEWKMSLAAVVALAHDVLITVGVYALSGFEVSPATVTGLLTILGYSLYDTVVVFDKVRENTRDIETSSQHTYAEAANLAVNQTLVRSINTSIAALLPVAALLWVGTVQIGSGPLKDLALALFVGMTAGTYSSICIATPLLVQIKSREPEMVEQERRVRGHRRHAPMPVAVAEAHGHSEPPAASPDPPPRTSPPLREGGPSKRAQPQRRSHAQRKKR
jgi:preprotein translocase subunit SecF